MFAIAIAGCTLFALFAAAHWLTLEPGAATTVAFLTIALAQLWHVFNIRSSEGGVLGNAVVGNPYVWAALALCLVLIVGAIHAPLVSAALELAPPGLPGWLLALGASLVPLVGGDLAGDDAWSAEPPRGGLERTGLLAVADVDDPIDEPDETLPPTILPAVTLTRFRTAPAMSGSTRPPSMATGMAYMLATECSNPAITNAAIGKMISTTLSVRLRPAKLSHTAKQTRTLQSTPRKKPSIGESTSLACAIVAAVLPTEPPSKSRIPDQTTRSAVPSAPRRLPRKTIDQLRNSSALLISRLPRRRR